MDAIVLAGGFGTRLKSVVSDLPKPMAPVKGKPFLEYVLRYLSEQNVNRVILSVGYKWEKIRDYFGASFDGLEIVYSIEDKPLGTGGAIKKALNFVEENDVFILNGDTYFPIDLVAMSKLHKHSEADITVALKLMEEYERYGSVVINDCCEIKGFIEKQYNKIGYINGGAYLLKANYINKLDLSDVFSFESDILEKYFNYDKFVGFVSKVDFIDIGIPDDYERSATII